MSDFKTMVADLHKVNISADKLLNCTGIISDTQEDSLFPKSANNEIFFKSLNIAIVGYTSDLVGYWDPFTCKTGLPGSEECAVYASEELAKRGHKVKLYMNPHPDSIWCSSSSNPQWLPENRWHSPDNSDTYDLVLMWRRFDPDTGRKRSKTVFFWAHDSPPEGQIYNFPSFDGICILSEHHRLQFNNWNNFNNVPYTICGNGIVPSHFETPMQISNIYSVGYFSNYSRGLGILISIWPEIRKEFPEATLSICYGRETWNTMSPDHLQNLINKITEYKDIGVTEHGKIGHIELASIMQQTSVWSYPCITTGETYCITAIKCQAAGCIPVTTRIGALDETVHPTAPNIPLIQNEQDITLYKQLLLDTLRKIKDSPNDKIIEERKKYINFASDHTWSSCLDKWLALYESVKK